MTRKVDFLITGLDYGGAEIQVVSLLLNIDRSRFSVRLISVLPPVAFVDQLTAAGIQVVSLGMSRKWQAPVALYRLVRLLIKNNTELLHAHMVHANFLARLAKLFVPKLKVLSSAHNINEGGFLREWVYSWTDWLSDLNTNVSRSAVDRYIHLGLSPVHKMHLVYNGIDTQRFHPAAAQPALAQGFKWLAVGRLEPQKDYPTLLHAIAVLRKTVTEPFTLDIVGKGYLEAELKQLAQDLGISDIVAFLGVRDNVGELYRQVNGFVLASSYEGYGLVVAEAMASALPVVVTDSGGPPEIVGPYGVVVPSAQPAAMAAAMAVLMAMSLQERHVMGAAARARICELYSLDVCIAKWKMLYETLLAPEA